MLVLLFLFSSVFCSSYVELSKFGSVEVPGYTNVYLDITSFNIGDVISFEFKMDLFFATFVEKQSYIFYIGQVSCSSYENYSCWENLPKVKNGNVTKNGDEFSHDYIFSWNEIKQEGKNYIFMKCPEPYNEFSKVWGYKIKIKNTGGSSANVSVIIISIVGAIIVIVVIIIIVIYCIKKRRYINLSQSSIYNAQIQQQYQQPIPFQQQGVIIQQNVIPQLYPYPQGNVYQNSNSIQQPNVVQPIVQPQINYGQPNISQQPYPQINVPNQVGQEPAPLFMNQQKNSNNYSSSKMGDYSKPEFNKGYSSSSRLN